MTWLKLDETKVVSQDLTFDDVTSSWIFVNNPTFVRNYYCRIDLQKNVWMSPFTFVIFSIQGPESIGNSAIKIEIILFKPLLGLNSQLWNSMSSNFDLLWEKCNLVQTLKFVCTSVRGIFNLILLDYNSLFFSHTRLQFHWRKKILL